MRFHFQNDAVELINSAGDQVKIFRNSSNMAPIGAKLCQNAFQTIPDLSFFDAEKKIETLNGRLPLEHGSDRRETLGKRVSSDLQVFIFRL